VTLMGNTHVLVEDKSQATSLVLFLAAIPVAVIASLVLRGDMTTGRWAIVAACAVIAGALIGGWLRTRHQPPGRIEISPEAIVQWRRNGRWVRLTRQAITIRQVRLQGRPVEWLVEGETGRVEFGGPGSPVTVREGSIGLLGYRPDEIAEVCRVAGWTLAPASR
jgi:hypothetical protein